MASGTTMSSSKIGLPLKRVSNSDLSQAIKRQVPCEMKEVSSTIRLLLNHLWTCAFFQGEWTGGSKKINQQQEKLVTASSELWSAYRFGDVEQEVPVVDNQYTGDFRMNFDCFLCTGSSIHV